MANNYNSNPIYLDTDIATGWRANQTLNTGNSPTTIQNPTASARQWGIEVTKVIISSNGTTAAGNVILADPNDAAILLSIPITLTQTPITLDYVDAIKWRDFKVTGLTATVTKLQIWYRA